MELARRAGVSPSYVSLIEHGEKIPSENVAVRIAHALDEREDLYRVWAVTSRMDERTREAVLRVGQSGELAEDDAREGDGLGAKPPAIDRQQESLEPGVQEDLMAHGVALPLLVPGASPTNGEIAASEVESHVAVDSRLLSVEPEASLAALRVDEMNGTRVRSWLREDDIAVLHLHPETLASGRIHALRVPGEGLVLSKVTRADERLLLLSDPMDDSPPRALRVADEAAFRETLFGTLVASFRSWR